jgi:hypothetical protein
MVSHLRHEHTGTIETEALRLLKHPGIALGIDRFRQSKVAYTFLTLEEHMAKLRELRDAAKADAQLSAAIRAEELRGRLCGFYAAKVERGEAGEFDGMSTDQLREFLVRETAALGLDKPRT